MKRATTSLLALIALTAAPPNVSSQGSLAPPGAPGPTMKSLEQIEARTIVSVTNTPGDSASTYIINLPGSYYLTSNLVGDAGKHGISIQADDVTLDLNGFALVCVTPASGVVRGIDVPVERKNLCIRNGTVRGWTDGGVRTDAAVGALIEKVRALENPGAPGIFVGLGGLVRDCVATANGPGFQSGDRAEFLSCIATTNTGTGFECGSYVSIVDCTASRNFGAAGISTGGSSNILRCNSSRNITLGTGIVAGTGSMVVDCVASNNQLDGIAVEAGSTVRDCTATANGRDGISVTSDCLVTGNNCRLNASSLVAGPPAAGIRATGNGNRIDSNTSSSNSAGYGIYLADGTSRNTVVRNVSTGHLEINFIRRDYWLPDSNNAPGAVAGSAGLETASPWANISY